MKKIRKLTADEIEVRVAQVSAKGAALLLYKTARVDRALLDEVYGGKWQNDFKVIDGKMYGGIGVFDEELKEWLWRWDCGTESNTEAEKGQASDCFKRAGFKYGIGVELYTAPFIFVKMDTMQEKGRWILSDRFIKFSVSEIAYEKDAISALVIKDTKGRTCFSWKKEKYARKEERKPAEQPEQPSGVDLIDKFLRVKEKLEKLEDASLPLDDPAAGEKIDFVTEMINLLTREDFIPQAKELEKLFNKKLKKPAQAA